jgi:DNA repair protein RecN (Recombination protein N)
LGSWQPFATSDTASRTRGRSLPYMLIELVVRDLALIEHVALAFGPGLNVITGETGAGKSLLVGALELLIGERAKPGLVRQGAKRAHVEARFTLPQGPAGERVLRWIARHAPQLAEEWPSDGQEQELILSRTLSSEGRTRSYANQLPVTRQVLSELSRRLIEIHGQNDHQRLLEPAEQLRLLDAFGGLEPSVEAYRRERAAWLALAQRSLRLQDEEAGRRDRLDLARFQLAEIRAVAPEPDERSRLSPEREMLRHAQTLKGGLANLVDELSESEGALLDRLRRAERFAMLWKDDVAAFAAPAAELSASRVHLEEAALALRSFLERLEVDPERLEAVEGRLAELERLERKYGVDAAGLADRARELEVEIARLDLDQASQEHLGEEIAAARERLLEHGAELRRARKALRVRLARAVHRALAELGLEKARFDLRLGQRAEDESDPARAGHRGRAALEADLAIFGERGMDRIEFLLSANPGEPLQRLREVASGGETARIMLALRSVLASPRKSARGPVESARSLVFDEIDAGVGGRLGPRVGAHLLQLAAHHQVLCVTHLPALAALAGRHLRVKKRVHEGRTCTEVEELSGEARVEEVADMIAGGAGHETARAEARRLLKG